MKRLDARVKLSLIVAACVLCLVILLKNVAGVPPEVLTRDLTIYAVVYTSFALFAPVRDAGTGAWALDSPRSLGLVTVLTTAAIVAFCAVAP